MVIRQQWVDGGQLLRLGLFDTCPRDATTLRIAPVLGQVLDKPWGRKPRATPQCFEEATALWR